MNVCVYDAMWMPRWGAYWALCGGLLVHARMRWCNGCGLVRISACNSGGCDMTAIATWQVVPA